MKKFMLYTLGGTTVFVAGAATATWVVGRMVLPVVDTDKVVDRVMQGYDKAQRAIERRVFGEEIKRPSPPPVIGVGYRPRNPN
jgi:hypothetical protein